ncbi:hypothetical protein Tco_1016389 [Tanacetum coccineum]|uniref:Uncharacterized protein n=1 Tax=Tanacetum coccineum TaxID=301880 RepID=A0ABQ5FPJ1_9ASTR
MESSVQFICVLCGSFSDEYGCQCSTCKLCGNDAHYGYDGPSQVPFVYNQDPCFNQNLDNFPQTSQSFPHLVFDNTLTAILSEPTVCPSNENEVDFKISLDESDNEDYTVIFDENLFSYKIIYFNDLKTDLRNDKHLSPNPTIDYFDDLDYFKDFKNEFPTIVYNDGLTSKSDVEIKPLISFEHIDEFNLIDEASLSEYDEEIVSCFNVLFNIIHPDDSKSKKDNDDNDIGIIQSSEDIAPLPAADERHPWLRYQIQEYTEGIREAGDGRALGLERSGLEVRFLCAMAAMRRLCHRMIAYSISGRGKAPKKVIGVDLFYLRNMDRGTTNAPHLLAQYLFRHAKGGRAGPDCGQRWFAQAIPAQAQHLPPPLLVQQPVQCHRGIGGELEEEVHDLWRDIVGLRGVVESFTIEQSRVFTWLITCITQLMDASGQTYHPFDSTLVGSSWLSLQRRVRPRIGDVSTSATPHTDA